MMDDKTKKTLRKGIILGGLTAVVVGMNASVAGVQPVAAIGSGFVIGLGVAWTILNIRN